VWLYVPSACLAEEPDLTPDCGLLAQALERSVMSRAESKTAKFWQQGLKRGRWSQRLSGLMFDRSTVSRGVEAWIASLADFPARTSALPAEAKESLRATDPASGSSSLASFARYDRQSSSWKTSALSLFEDSTPFSGSWPKAGTMRNGVCFERPIVALRTGANGFSSWPTPRSEDSESAGNHPGATDSLTGATRQWSTPHGMGGRDSTGKAGGSGGGEFAKQANQWPTPKAITGGANSKREERSGAGGPDLQETAAHWQTPAADSFRSRGGDRKDEMRLDQQARNHEAQNTHFWGSPRAAEYKGSGPEGSKSHQHQLDRGYLDAQSISFHPDPAPSTNGETFSAITLGSPLPSQRKKLNPIFVAWLMGWPLWWCTKEPMPYGCSEMASYLFRQRRHLFNLLGGLA